MTRDDGLSTSPPLRQRIVRGAQAQAFGHAVRVIVQLGSVALFTSLWGIDLYGEWLMLAALPGYLAVSDIGFVAAAANEMTMAVGRADRDRALAVFQAVAGLVLVIAAAVVVVLPMLTSIVPVADLLNLSAIPESTASWVILLLGLNAVIASYDALLYGGFACVGRYGEGAFALSAIMLLEFVGLAAAATTREPVAVAGAMLAGRAAGTGVMFGALRRRAPWLRHGRPRRVRGILRELLGPSLATGAFPLGFALSVQGMVLLIGHVLGPASAAIFATLRTLSRAVIQLLSAISSVVVPEISRAFGMGDIGAVRTIHRRGCQASVWLSALAVAALAVVGPSLLEIWTSGAVGAEGALLYLFLAVTVIDSFWYTSAAVLIATNRHQRVAVDYVAGCLATLPIAYVLLEAFGLPGGAFALLILEIYMLVVVLRRALPAAHDTLGGLARELRAPPLYMLGGHAPARGARGAS